MLAVGFCDAIKKGSFTALIVSETEILLTLPILPYGLFNDGILRNGRLKIIRLHHSQLQPSQDMVINHLWDEVGRSVNCLTFK